MAWPCGLVLCRLDSFRDVLASPFITNGAVVTFDICIVLWVHWLSVFQPHTLRVNPSHQRFSGVFWAVTNTNSFRFATPFNDLIETSHDALTR